MSHVVPGARVLLKGINGAPELNGKLGVADGFRQEIGRWHVRLDDGRTVDVRPECIEVGQHGAPGWLPPLAPMAGYASGGLQNKAGGFGQALVQAAMGMGADSVVPQVGQPCEIYSNSSGGWLAGHVEEVLPSLKCREGHALVHNPQPANNCDINTGGCTERGTTFRCGAGCDFDVCDECFKANTMVKVAFTMPNGKPAGKTLPCGHPQMKLNGYAAPPAPVAPVGTGAFNFGGMAGGLANIAGDPSSPMSRMSNGRTALEVSESSRYRVCLEGTKCRELDKNKKDRSASHLEGFSHPFDPDYDALCEKCSVQRADYEERSLMGLFRWLDADASGKLDTVEIMQGLELLSRLTGDGIPSVEALDEDGNGAVNFSEFAQWAGPRLGLPLGLKMERKGSTFITGTPCAIAGCPCQNFQLDTRVRKKAPTGKRAYLAGLFSAALGGSGEAQHRLDNCTCSHKKSAHTPTDIATGLQGNPHYWKNKDFPRPPKEVQEFVPVPSEATRQLNDLFRATYKNTWTRDRKKHSDRADVPKGYQVIRAERNENSKTWRSYNWRKSVMVSDYEEASSHYPEYTSLSSQWQSLSKNGAERLASQVNELYLFHGCSDWVAHKICETDFHIGSAGKNTGTLYGKGSYLAESITKVDEYAKPNDKGEYCVLLVRALAGNVHYTDQAEPDPEELTQGCIEGPYDCVLGDREKCRGTYKEFVFYDSDDLYPEYIIFYNRIY